MLYDSKVGKKFFGTVVNNDGVTWTGAYTYVAAKPPSAQVINSTQEPVEEALRNAPAANRPLPLVYGRAQVGGQLFAAGYDNGRWTVGYILGYGEMDAIEAVWINGEAKTVNTLVNTYLGTTNGGLQIVDADLVSAISGYNDNLLVSHPIAGSFGIAYIVVDYSEEDYPEWPDVVVQVRGRKVYNPVAGVKQFSQNPALHLADYINDPVAGMNRNIDWTSVEQAAAFCDELVGGETRCQSYMVLKRKIEAERGIDLLRAYAMCNVYNRNGTYFLVPDSDTPPVYHVTPRDIVAGSVTSEKKDVTRAPTVVATYYTDTSETIWRSKLSDPAKVPGVDTNQVETRNSTVRMDGIFRHSEAYRNSVQRINKLTLSDLVVRWQQYGSASALLPGEIITFTQGFGFSEKLLRLSRVEQIGPGIWSMEGEEHDPAANSTEVVTQATFPDAVVPNNITPGAVTGITASEVLYQLPNGTYASRLDISWTKPANSLVTDYFIEVLFGATVVWSGTTAATTIPSGPLGDIGSHTIQVYARNSLRSGPVASTTALIDGKTSLPATPTGLTGQNNNTVVFLSWDAAADADTYEVRYYTTAQVWANGTVLDTGLKATTFTTNSVPAGLWSFSIKSIDSVGNYCAVATKINITVQASASGVTVFYQTGTPTANAVGDLWYDTDDNNHVKYWDGNSWESLRDGTIIGAQNDATQALSDALAASNAAAAAVATADDASAEAIAAAAAAANAEAIADGKITTFLQASEPTAGESGVGDIWLKGTAASPAAYDAFRTNLGFNYAMMMDGSIDNNGTVSDQPAYAGTYGSLILPNRQSGQGINQLYNGWAATQLDVDGGKHSVAMTVGIPATISDGSYGLYSNGNGTRGQGFYIRAVSNVCTLVVGHTNSSLNTDAALIEKILTPGAHTVCVSYADGTPNHIVLVVDAALQADVDCTLNISDSGGNPFIGDMDTLPATGDTISTIDGSGIVIGDFLENQDGDVYLTTDFYDFHNELFGATGSVLSYRYNGTSWELFADSGIDAAELAALEAQATADQKIVSFYQDAEPSGAESSAGDLWVDTNNSNRLFRYNGTVWQDARDAGIIAAIDDASQAIADAAAAQAAADLAQATADGKIVTFFQTTTPSGASVGDIWLDGSAVDGEIISKRYNGSSWIVFSDSGITQAQIDANNAAIVADSKIITFYQNSAPANGVSSEGDLWVDTTAGVNRLHRYDGSTSQWIEIKDSDIDVAISDASDALDAANAAKVSEGAQISSNASAASGSRYPVNTQGGTEFTINLPTSPTQGDLIGFFDLNETWHITSAFLNPGSGKSIENGANNEDFELNVKGMSILLQWTTSKGWVMV